MLFIPFFQAQNHHFFVFFGCFLSFKHVCSFFSYSGERWSSRKSLLDRFVTFHHFWVNCSFKIITQFLIKTLFCVFQMIYLVLPDSPTIEPKCACPSSDSSSWNTEQPFNHGDWSPINSPYIDSDHSKREQDTKIWRLLALLEQEVSSHRSTWVI